MEEDRRGIVVSMISVGPVEDAGGGCEGVSLNRVAFSTFAIGDTAEDAVILCRLILDLENHSPW